MYCARHPRVDANRECTRCGALHCLGCVRWLGNERGRLAACGHCDGVLRELAVRTVVPPAVAIPDLIGRLRGREALAMLAVIVALAALGGLPLPIIDVAFIGLAVLVTAATAINLIEHLAHGRPGFPSPVGADATGWMPFVQRGALLTTVLVAAPGLWLGANRGAEDLRELVIARPLMALLMALVSSLWFAAASIAVLASDRALPAFWPPALIEAARRSRPLLLSLSALALAGWVLGAAFHEALRLSGWPPLLTAALRGGVLAAMVFALAALAGGLVHRHADVVLDHSRRA